MNKKGFTLVEMCIVLVIIGIVMSPLAFLFISANNNYSSGKERMQVHNKVRLTVYNIVEDLRKYCDGDISTGIETKVLEPNDIGYSNFYNTLRIKSNLSYEYYKTNNTLFLNQTGILGVGNGKVILGQSETINNEEYLFSQKGSTINISIDVKIGDKYNIPINYTFVKMIAISNFIGFDNIKNFKRM